MSFDRYRRRVTIRGSNAKDIILHERIQSFNDYLDKSISGQEVLIDGVKHLVGIQDVKFHDERNREAKYIFTKLDAKVVAGSLVTWDDACWLVVMKENETIKSHNTFYMTKCNEVLTWKCENGLIHRVPCILADKTSVYSDGLSKTEHLSLGTDQVSILVPFNDETNAIPINKRLIFRNDQNNIYELVRKDGLLREGLINFVSKKSLYNPNIDRLDLNLANYDGNTYPDTPVNPDIPIEPDKPAIPVGLAISGLDYITIWDENFEYIANTDMSVSWTLDRDDLIEIVNIDGNKCYISSSSTSTIGKTILRVELNENPEVFDEMVISKYYQ